MREQIVRAAVELADEGGLEAASVRRIAGQLGVGATSLYWHVRNKSDLHELMYDSVLGEVGDLPEPTGDWRADLQAAAIATRNMFSKHPCNNYLTGFAHRTTAWEQIRQRAGLTDKEWERRLGQYLVHARQIAPQLAVDIESRLHLTSDRSFLLGLDCLLDGIAARFALAPPAS